VNPYPQPYPAVFVEWQIMTYQRHNDLTDTPTMPRSVMGKSGTSDKMVESQRKRLLREKGIDYFKE
jgi:hypothetical protein